jgi:DNA-binding winged helix-turn-helix (wHTH) protein
VTPAVLQFEGFELDCARYELRRNGRPLKLEKIPMELLQLLAESGGRLVTREEIEERLWGKDVFVDAEHGINTAVRKIRQVLEDDPNAPRFVLTVPRKGYRFIAEVRRDGAEPLEPVSAAQESPQTAETPVQQNRASATAAKSAASTGQRKRIWLAVGVAALLLAWPAYRLASSHATRAALAPPVIRSIAVLPLENLSGDATQEYFADGMTDELITMLAKYKSLRVISRTSVMQYKKAKKSLPEIARELCGGRNRGGLEFAFARQGADNSAADLRADGCAFVGGKLRSKPERRTVVATRLGQRYCRESARSFERRRSGSKWP